MSSIDNGLIQLQSLSLGGVISSIKLAHLKDNQIFFSTIALI
jgi:hypothetical protein